MIKGILCKMFNLVPKAELELITKELDKLKEEHAALSKENTALVEKISALQEEKNQLSANKDAEIDKLNKENQELRNNLSSLQSNATMMQSNISSLQEQNTALENEKRSLEQKLSDSETKIATLTRENNKLIQSSATALEQINDLGNKNEALKSQVKEYHTICEKYREKIKDSEVEKTAEIEKLNNENQELQDNLSDLQRNNVTLRNNISDLQKQNTVLEQQNRNLGQKLSDTDTKIATLTRENNKLIQSSATALEQIKELESNLLSLQKNTANMQKDAANMQSTIYILQEENTALENEKKDLKQKLSDTDTKIATLTRENNKLIQSSATALEQIKAQELKNDAFKLQVKNLQTLNDKYSRKINEYSEKEKQQTKEHTESLETLKTEHAKTIDTLQSEIHKYQKELNEKTAIIGEYELTLIKRNKEIKDVRDENSLLNKEVVLLNSNLNSANDSLARIKGDFKEQLKIKDKNTTTKTPNEEIRTRNLKLTESLDIKSTILEVKKENILSRNSQIIYQDPRIKYIIEKLRPLNITLLYKYDKFYIKKKNGQEELLRYQNLEIYNELILVLTDGKYFAGYDMNTGKRISDPNKNKYTLFTELDDYYEIHYK